jgi:hypothetical protein
MKRLASNKRPSGAKYVFASSMVHSPSFVGRFTPLITQDYQPARKPTMTKRARTPVLNISGAARRRPAHCSKYRQAAGIAAEVLTIPDGTSLFGTLVMTQPWLLVRFGCEWLGRA